MFLTSADSDEFQLVSVCSLSLNFFLKRNFSFMFCFTGILTSTKGSFFFFFFLNPGSSLLLLENTYYLVMVSPFQLVDYSILNLINKRIRIICKGDDSDCIYQIFV